MAVLSWIGTASVVGILGCYSPELRDCTVSCEVSAECAPGQVCGTDGMCAAPSLAGHCGGPQGTIDAAIDRPLDAAPIDAPAQQFVRIEINSRGGVTIAGTGTCHHTAPMSICLFGVTAGMVVQLEAVPDPDYRFDKWESGPCVNQGLTCAFLPTMALTDLKVKFREDD